MKSTLKIALGSSNEPVIEFKVIASDDIRDQLCCQFLNKLGTFPSLCSVSNSSYRDNPGEQYATVDILNIVPITSRLDVIGNTVSPIENINMIRGAEEAIRQQRGLVSVGMWVTGDYIGWENKLQNSPVNTYSIELDRRYLEKQPICDIVIKVNEIFDDINNWETSVKKQSNL